MACPGRTHGVSGPASNSSQMSLYGCTVPNICDVSYPPKQKLSTDASVMVTGLSLPQLFACEEENTDPFVLMFFLCQCLFWWSWKSPCPALCSHLPVVSSIQAATERQSAVYNDHLQPSRLHRRPRQGQSPAFCLS